MTGPRIVLVTNDAARAALELWCHPGNLPPSVAVVDNPDHMLRIPNGVSVRCYWYGTRETIAAWESWWTQRRLRGGFSWVSEEDWSRLMDWAERARKAPTLKLTLGIELEVAAEAVAEPVAAPALPAIEQSRSQRGSSKWR